MKLLLLQHGAAEKTIELWESTDFEDFQVVHVKAIDYVLEEAKRNDRKEIVEVVQDFYNGQSR